MEPFQFNLTEAILVKAAQLHGGKSIPVSLGMAALVAVAISVYSLLDAENMSIERGLLEFLLILTATMVSAGCVLALTHFWINPMHARRNFRQQKMLAQGMSISWTDARFVFACADSRADMAFSDLYGYRASNDLVLLYLSQVLYYAIPRKSLDGLDLANDLLEKLQAAQVRRR
jgi:hypothetical protein